jgi:nitroreductase
VFIGGIRNDPRKVCDLLRIPEKVYPVFGMCLGYPDQSPPVKPRLPMEAIFKTDQYDRKNEAGFLKAYDRVTNTYYKTRDSNLKVQTWTGQIADFMSQKIRPHMKSFIQKQGFFIR